METLPKLSPAQSLLLRTTACSAESASKVLPAKRNSRRATTAPCGALGGTLSAGAIGACGAGIGNGRSCSIC